MFVTDCCLLQRQRKKAIVKTVLSILSLLLFGVTVSNISIAAENAAPVPPLNSRTQQVREAIVAAAGVNSANDVTQTHLAAITNLDLSKKSITALTVGDFDGLTALETLFLYNNNLTSLPAGIFDKNTALVTLEVWENNLTSLPAGIFDKNTKLERLHLSNNDLVSLPTGIFDKNTALKSLYLAGNNLRALPTGIFDKNTALIYLNLIENQISDVSALENVTSLDDLYLKGNPISDHRPLRRLMKRKKRIFIDIRLNNPPAFEEGESTTRSVAENTASGTNIGDPVSATDADITEANTGNTSPSTRNPRIRITRRKPANTGDTLTYSLGGTDAASFRIVESTGQLQTKAALDYETQKTYSVTITVHDRKKESDSITVTITVTNANDAPVFADSRTTRAIEENTASGQNIGAAVTATDPDGDTLAYSLSGTDAAVFSIVESTGQLQTKAALDYETESSYTVTLTVSDGNLTDSIDVTITVTNANDAPIFADSRTTRAIEENTASGQNIGAAITATDPDGDTLAYSLSGTDAAVFRIVESTGQLQTKAALDYETESSYTVTLTASDGNLTDSIDVTITVTNANDAPVFADSRTTRAIEENTASGQNIGDPITATDPDDDTLTYTLEGTDATSFRIVESTGQLQTKAALDYETQDSYTLTVAVSDGNGGSDSITVTINVTDVPNLLTARTPQVRAAIVAAVGVRSADDVTQAHLAAITNLDLSKKSITALKVGDFDGLTALETLYLWNNDLGALPAGIFDENTALIQLDLENNDLGALPAGIFDENTALTGLDLSKNQISDVSTVESALENVTSLRVLIIGRNPISDYAPLRRLKQKIPDLSIDIDNIPPVFEEGDSTTRSVAENTAAGTNIGDPVSATDADNDTLTYSLGGTHAASFSIVESTGQLQRKEALGYGDYAVVITVHDSKGSSDSIGVKITVTTVNNAPVFADSSTTRSIAEHTAPGQNIGDPITATDPDDDTLSYGISGTDARSFSIVVSTGQLQTKSPLNYETKDSYTLTVSAADRQGDSDSIDVTISVTDVNEAPVFAYSRTIRFIAENTASGQNIGAAITATDPDDDTLAYSLSGTDAAAFSIVSDSGQLQTKAALDYETESSYTVTLTVSDGNLMDSIDVTISVTDVNDAPVFADSRTTRAITENTPSGQNIGDPITATDPDDDTLAYSLSGTDATSFSIVSDSGQLQTMAALDYETESSYTVTLTASDGNLTDSIDVTISVTDVNDAPVFADSRTTRSIVENTPSGQNIGDPVSATDADTGDTLTYSLGGTDAASFRIVESTGQLQTKAALDYETQKIYSVTITVQDSKGSSDTIGVTINVTRINDAPVFADSRTTRSIAEITPSGQNIGDPITATDPDGDTLTYTLEGTDAASFSIVESTGQLQTKAALDYETKEAYTLTVSVSDGYGGSDSITVIIIVTNIINLRLSERTPQVRAAIVAAAGVSSEEVAPEHLAAITKLNLADKSISSLDVGDFYQLTALKTLNLSDNALGALPADIFDDNTALETLYLFNNALGALPAGIFDNNTALVSLDLSGNALGALPAGIFDNNTALKTLYLFNNDLGALPAGIFDKNTKLETLYLSDNALRSLPAGIFDNNTKLRILDLSANQISDVSALENMASLHALYLKENPVSDYQPIRKLKFKIAKFKDLSIDLDLDHSPPTFDDGDSTTRSVVENTPPGTNIGDPVSATARQGFQRFLTYSLDGTDAASFSIVSDSGQLQTKAALDYETQKTYSVTITVYDGHSGGDRITVTINVTDVNEEVAKAPAVQARATQTGLLPNYPNPFNPETWIPYQLAKPADVTLTIYDISGVVVRRLALGHRSAGVYYSRSRAAYWDGKNEFGEKVATGAYFYTLTAGEFTATRKMLIRK